MNMKKIVAGVMAVATVASLSVTSFAAGPDTVILDNSYITHGMTILDDKNFSGDEVNPDKTLYYIPSFIAPFTSAVNSGIDAEYDENAADLGYNPNVKVLFDTDLFKVKFDKGDYNSKMIKKMSVVEKNFDGIGRTSAIKIELNDDMTDKEYKIEPVITFTAKKNIINAREAGRDTDAGLVGLKTGSKITMADTLYIANTGENADRDYTVGTGGVILKPTKNDENEITWEDANNDIARLDFTADSDIVKIFPKLSTKWDNSEYAGKFADQDAFIRSFVGNPTISSTSRAVLTLYNPYIDEDEELTVDVEDIIIYQVIDGELVDVTASFTASTNDDGDEVFTTKTRKLGTYIIAQAPAATVVEEPTTEEGKVVPNTGR